MLTLESISPNSSSFCLSGEAAVCVEATCSPMRPISVRAPVSTTTATAEPYEIVVPEKTMLSRDWISAAPSTTSSASFIVGSDSPVRMAWSARSVVEVSSSSRTSAGARQPTLSRTMSPGTSSGDRT